MVDSTAIASYIGQMLTLSSIGEQIAERRKSLRLSQTALAKQAGVGRSTLDALENGRSGELGFSKIIKLLTALGLELTLKESRSRRPTYDELMREEDDDQSLDRRR
jgi:transcriptional regulator with XRE-family HTH domain